MSPETVSLWQDAIKILGPASIAGWFAYRAGKVQLMTKLKELQAENSFKAREHLFSYYQERAKQSLQSQHQLGDGKLTADLEDEDDEETTKEREARLRFCRTVVSMLSMYVPTEIPAAQSQLASAGFGSSPYHARLQEYLSKAQWHNVGQSREEILERALLLFKVYSLLGACGQVVLTQRAEQIFATHLK